MREEKGEERRVEGRDVMNRWRKKRGLKKRKGIAN